MHIGSNIGGKIVENFINKGHFELLTQDNKKDQFQIGFIIGCIFIFKTNFSYNLLAYIQSVQFDKH